MKDETWKQALADHTCHHKFEDMNTSEMEVAEFVAATISVKNESIDDWNQKIEAVVTKIFYSVATKGKAEASINAGINEVKKLLAGYAANQTKNNKQ